MKKRMLGMEGIAYYLQKARDFPGCVLTIQMLLGSHPIDDVSVDEIQYPTKQLPSILCGAMDPFGMKVVH